MPCLYHGPQPTRMDTVLVNSLGTHSQLVPEALGDFKPQRRFLSIEYSNLILVSWDLCCRVLRLHSPPKDPPNAYCFSWHFQTSYLNNTLPRIIKPLSKSISKVHGSFPIIGFNRVRLMNSILTLPHALWEA